MLNTEVFLFRRKREKERKRGERERKRIDTLKSRHIEF
jgi:hypothetical protein